MSKNLLLHAAVFLLVAFFTATASAQDADAFSRGNQQFAAGQFRESIESYSELVASGETSAALFYNIGNAQYRVGDFGAAILNYERALVLEPHHPEAEANLRLVRDKARALELKRSRWGEVVTRGTVTQYSVVAAVSFWIALFAIAALCFARRRTPVAVMVLIFASVACALAIAGLYSVEAGPRGKMLAIVTAKATDARLATADSSGTVLTLPPGSEINILSTRGEWIYAALPNDLRGWIPAKNAERVRL